MKKFKHDFVVTIFSDDPREVMRDVLVKLVDSGLDDAANTVEQNEGDLEAAEAANNADILIGE